ncbi:MAG TPA: PIN domain-containing protein, partial [Terriglobales bacterium]|nr:PIN domain-containing protein [Terriglobales bacterium]
MKRVLVDTGPLVAILSRTDEHHKTCVQALRDLPGPLFSCWPVITEAAWLLRAYPLAIQQLLKSIGNGFVELLPLASTEAKAIADVMKRYENIRPQLADATLVYLADRDG